MLKLYGFDVSNYYNMIKLAMAVKGIPYEAVMTYPNQSEEYLCISPMGKVPALETDEGILVETSVIIEYLDEQFDGPSLFPGTLHQRMQIKELCKIIELYIELPARRCLNEAFFGVPVHEQTKKEAKHALINGIKGLTRVASFSPYVAGKDFTAADIFFLYSIDLASTVGRKLFEIDLLESLPAAKSLLTTLNQREDVKAIAAQRDAAQPAFHAYLAEAFKPKGK